MKVALIQFTPESYQREENLDKSLNLASKAVEKGAKIIVLPELFDSGYCVEDKDSKFGLDFAFFQKAIKNKRLKELSSKYPTLHRLYEFAKTHSIHIITSSIEKDKNKFYDSAYIINKEGLVGKYRKIYLWGNEKKRFQRGKDYPIFKLKIDKEIIKVGLGICYEIGFGEGARFLSLKGAQILIYPAAFGKARNYVWDLASRARALENGVFVLANNRSGSEVSKLNGETLEFAANSRIINPKGEILTQALQDEEVIVADLNLAEVTSQREALPYLKDLNVKLNQKVLKELLS
ncbi:carbon-nitrogen hydrolase family protein [Helicobacter sp. MIT 11-5569]|uniref:carbon-nitrogen hydrolase family protein n=1 Tax=Helicobacter sp. MIT 11-5569 TaxID=1548151 RepID=UPI00051F9C93|nr:carbon-nitrogen hydrolase family protein [Helicobacter sp. MIT 11-5569]TLD85078.1 carbon-nitrogen hydrolase family protein [Helicobacter sp. MIT 11-5569]